MDEDTGNNSELEDADTCCRGQENVEEREQAGGGGHKMYTVNCKTLLKAKSSPNKR